MYSERTDVCLQIAEMLLIDTDFYKFKDKINAFVKSYGYRELISNKELVEEFLSRSRDKNNIITPEIKKSFINLQEINIEIRLLRSEIIDCSDYSIFKIPDEIKDELCRISYDIKENFTRTIEVNFKYNVLFKTKSEIKDLTRDELLKMQCLHSMLLNYESGNHIREYVNLIDTFNISDFFMMLAIPQYVVLEDNVKNIKEKTIEIKDRFEKVKEKYINFKSKNI